jgi:predicted N-acetyltransferase YhbS
MPQNASSATEAALRTRLATEADLARLIPLINSAFSVETFFDGTRTDEERLKANLQKGEILVAENASGQLLACIYLENRGARGYLGQLAVDPAMQRAGLGRGIVLAAENRLRSQGCEAVEITVLNLRSELPPIYRRFGYIETATEPFHSPRPLKPGAECHCIVMTKRL